MNVPIVRYDLIYNGKNITQSILQYVLSFTYTDKAQGEADELEISMEDVDGLWKNEWYPSKGDKVTARIITINGTLECGTFTVDELSGSGNSEGDMFTLKAIAAPITKALRTKNSYAHENKTLKAIANTIAAKHGLKVVGKIDNIIIDRVTQYRETDLNFLRRLASDYGFTFSIRDSQMIFTNIYEIEDRTAALTISKNELTAWQVSDKTNKTYQKATVAHHNPKKKKVFTYTYQENRPAYNGVTSETLHLKVRASNQQQAMLKAKAALYNHNSLQQEGTLEMPGNIYAIAGNACEVDGIGRFSGKYYIHGSTHTVTKDGGYTSNLQIKRIGLVLKSKEKS